MEGVGITTGGNVGDWIENVGNWVEDAGDCISDREDIGGIVCVG